MVFTERLIKEALIIQNHACLHKQCLHGKSQERGNGGCNSEMTAPFKTAIFCEFEAIYTFSAFLFLVQLSYSCVTVQRFQVMIVEVLALYECFHGQSFKHTPLNTHIHHLNQM